MKNRITLVSVLDEHNLSKIEFYTNKLNTKLCKVPFGKIPNREEANTIPYHFTIFAWDISNQEKVTKELSKLSIPKIKVLIDNISIMNGKENSYVLYFSIAPSHELKKFQQSIYQIFPNEKYNPATFIFHLTIHIDQDYDKIISLQNKLLEVFTPFKLEFDTLELYKIWPPETITKFPSKL